MAPTDPELPVPLCAGDITASPSSHGRRLTPAASDVTTSLSTTTLAPPPARPDTPSRSPPPTTPCSIGTAAAVHCGRAAPPLDTAEPCASNLTTSSSSKLAAPGVTATSPPTTDDG